MKIKQPWAWAWATTGLLALGSSPGPAQTIYREYFSGIPGATLTDLTNAPGFPDNPSGRSWQPLFEAPVNFDDNYGTRLRGFVIAPLTGNYTFWIAGDDQCALFLSSNANPANRTQIAAVPAWSNPRQWDQDPAQQSALIPLQAGQRYYIEALHKDGGGGDHLAVGWQLPDATQERPIPGNRLIPFVNPPTAFLNSGDPWRYIPVGSDLGTTWRTPGYNDVEWFSGPSPLGFGKPNLATTVGSPGQVVTYYFRRGFQVANPAGFNSLALRLRRDDGGIVYLNGTEVFRSNMPGGTVDFLTTTTSAPDNGDAWNTNSVNPALLVNGLNVVAVEIHQNALASSDLVFDLELTGNVETVMPTTESSVDFGDAPDSVGTPLYPTLLANDGARHLINSNLVLGVLIDGETNGQPNAAATGDNLAARNDEDGIRFLTDPLVPGMKADIEVTATVSPGLTALLDAWIDYNLDRTWNVAGVERILTNQTVINGVQTFTIMVPSGAAEGTSFARFRLHRAGSQNLGPAGAAPLGFGEEGQLGEGEVEDYFIEIQNPGGFDLSLAKTDDPDPVLVGDILTYSLAVSNAGPDTAANVVATDTLPPAVVVLSAASGGIPCKVTGSTVTCDLGDLAPAASAFVTIQVQPLEPGVLSNCATVSGEGLELNPADNDTCVTTVVEAPPDQTIPCDQTNKGTNFWLTFPGSYAPDPAQPTQPRLVLVGMPGVTGRVRIPALGYVTNYTIGSGMRAFISLPREADLGEANDLVLTNRGVQVLASDEVAVFARNGTAYSSGRYLALPTVVAGTEYVVQAWGNVQPAIPELYGSQFAVAAGEDNTVITITPSSTTGRLVAGQSYVRVLNRGDVYQLRNTNGPPGDLTGTFIAAGKPVSVFAGHLCANVPDDQVFACDYVVEQLFSVAQGGREFLATPFSSRLQGDTFRILSLQDTNNVWLNGTNVTLHRGQFTQVILTDPTHITADRPVTVTQFAHSADYDQVTVADPFMTVVPDLTKFHTNHMVYVPEEGYTAHYANLLFLDGTMLSVNGRPYAALGGATDVDGSGLSYVQVVLPPGTNVISGSAPFGSILYGFNEFEAYGSPGALFFGDGEPPAVVCTLFEDRVPVNDNCLGAAPNYLQVPVGIEDNCSSPQAITRSQEPPPDSLLPPGIHPVEVRVTDAAGHTAVCIVTLTVEDLTPPRIDCPADRTVSATGPAGAVVSFAASAVDNCDPSPQVVCSPESGSLFPVGVTPVTCTATDASGNSAFCTFFVTVEQGQEQALDFGDARDPNYPTLLSSDGARHRIVEGWFLGQLVDAETNGRPSIDALGDDLAGTPDDEDGVRFLTSLTAGAVAAVEVISSTNGLLDAWIDFNRDGQWQLAEQIFSGTVLARGTNPLTFTVPAGLISAGRTQARFRLSEKGGLGVRGLASEGEVEDYALDVLLQFDDQPAAPSGDATVGVVSNKLVVANLGTNGTDGVELPLDKENPIVWQVSLDSLVLTDPESVFSIRIYGDWKGASNVYLASTTFSNGSGGLSLTGDFSGLTGGTADVHVEVWSMGTLAGTFSNVPPRLLLNASAGTGLDRAGFTLASQIFFGFGFSQPVSVAPAGSPSAPLVGDGVILRLSDTAPFPLPPSLIESPAAGAPLEGQRLSRVAITAARLPAIIINRLEAEGRSPRLRVARLPDGRLALSWLDVLIPFDLEGTVDVADPLSWQTVTPDANTLVNGRRTLLVRPPAPGEGFFRLHADGP